MKKIRSLKTVPTGCILFMILEAVTLISAAISGLFMPGALTVFNVIRFVVVGIFEETLFRALPVMIFKNRLWSLKSRILLIAVSSALFSLFHLVNLLSGASLSYTLLQIFYAFCFGVFFCFIYLCSGRILIPVLMHIIHDIITASTTPDLTGAIIYTGKLSPADLVFPLIHSLILLVFTVIFIDTERADVL